MHWHVVPAHGGDLYEESSLLVILQHKAHALLILLDGQGTDISVLIAQAEPDRADMVGQDRLAQEGIIPFSTSGAPSGRPAQISSFALQMFS
mgnify:FL=1